MKIVVLVGGTNNPSNSEALADAFIDGIRSIPGFDAEKIRLRERSIEHFTMSCYAPDFRDEPDFADIRAKVEEADGLVVASPIWNFGIPANLKNVIDRLGASGLDPATRSTGQWKDKPAYLIFTGGAPWAAWPGLFRQTTSFVPTALQYFGAAHIGTHYEPRCMVSKGVFGFVMGHRPDSVGTVRAKGATFALTVERFVRTGKLPMLKRFMRRLYVLAQKIQKRLR